MLLTVRTQYAPPFTVPVDQLFTVDDLAQAVWTHVGIPVSEQRLLTVVEDVPDLEPVARWTDSTDPLLCMEVRPDIQIQLYSPDGASCVVETPPGEYVMVVKAMAESRLGIPHPEMRFLYGGKELEDNRTLCEYGIGRGARVCVFRRQQLLMTVEVVTMDRQSVMLENISPSNMVRDIRLLTESRLQVLTRDQIFCYEGQSLENERSLRSYGIDSDVIVHLANDKIGITVNIFGGAVLPFRVSPYYTVAQLKQDIYTFEGIQVRRQRLEVHGIEVTDADLLYAVGITQGLVVDLREVRQMIGISVKTLLGRRVAYQVDPSNSADELKLLIQLKTGFPPPLQQLVYLLTQPEGSNSLESYGIVEGSVVHLVLRTLGTMPVKVRLFDGSTVKVEVDPLLPAATIRFLAEELTGEPITNCCMSRKYKVVDEAMSISLLGMRKNSSVDLRRGQKINTMVYQEVAKPVGRANTAALGGTTALGSLGKKPKVSVPVISESGVVKVSVLEGLALFRLKGKLEKITGVPRTSIGLTLVGRVLESGKRLLSYRIRPGSVIQMQRVQASYDVFVRTLRGEVVQMEVGGAENVAAVKGQVESISQVPATMQRLLGATGVMGQGDVAGLGVYTGMTIDMEQRVRGG